MISYIIEFAIIHIALFAVYKLLLSNETSLWLRRVYLIGMTTLALCLPLIEIPVQTSSSFNLSSSVATYVLPEINGLANNNQVEIGINLAWYELLFLSLTLVAALRFVVGLTRIVLLYTKSSPYYLYSTKLRHFEGLSSIFTFFNWIFIDKNTIDDAKIIIKHEQAHVDYGHSYDLLFLNLLTIVFWWVPTHWFLIEEMKQVHEYQADAIALNDLTKGDYTKTLIKYTLRNHGLALANSFSDTTLTKRLKFMNKSKQSINLWKLVGLTFILSGAIYMASCQGSVTQELETQAEKTNLSDNEIFLIVDNPADYPGGIEEFYTYVQSELKFTPKAREYGISGKIFVEFVVNRDGSKSDFKILRGLGYGLDEQAIRIIKNSSKWLPAKNGDKVVRQKLVLPIIFKLDTRSLSNILEEPVLSVSYKSNFSMDNSENNYADSEFLKSTAGFLTTKLEYLSRKEDSDKSSNVVIQYDVDSDGSVTMSASLKN